MYSTRQKFLDTKFSRKGKSYTGGERTPHIHHPIKVRSTSRSEGVSTLVSLKINTVTSIPEFFQIVKDFVKDQNGRDEKEQR